MESEKVSTQEQALLVYGINEYLLIEGDCQKRLEHKFSELESRNFHFTDGTILRATYRRPGRNIWALDLVAAGSGSCSIFSRRTLEEGEFDIALLKGEGIALRLVR